MCLPILNSPGVPYLGQALRHAGYLDAGFMLGAAKAIQKEWHQISVPVSISAMHVNPNEIGHWVYVRLLENSEQQHRCSIQWLNQEGMVVDALDAIEFRVAPKNKLLQSLYQHTSRDATFYDIA